MMLEGIKEETEGQYIICIEHIQQSSYKVYTHLAKGIYIDQILKSITF